MFKFLSRTSTVVSNPAAANMMSSLLAVGYVASMRCWLAYSISSLYQVRYAHYAHPLPATETIMFSYAWGSNTHCWNHWSLRVTCHVQPTHAQTKSDAQTSQSKSPYQCVINKHHTYIPWPIYPLLCETLRYFIFIIVNVHSLFSCNLLALDGRCRSVTEMFMFGWFKEPLSRPLIKHSCVAAVVVDVAPASLRLLWPLHFSSAVTATFPLS